MKEKIIRHKTIYGEDLFLMRSRIDYRFLIYLTCRKGGKVHEAATQQKRMNATTANIKAHRKVILSIR